MQDLKKSWAKRLASSIVILCGHCGLSHCYGPTLMMVATRSRVVDDRLPSILTARIYLNDIFAGWRILHVGRVMAVHHLAVGDNRSLPIRIELSHQDNRAIG
jgi:hypothetical protein